MIQPTPRVEYAVAGIAGRAAIARALELAALPRGTSGRITERDLRVLLAVLSLTALYSKVSDKVYVAKIQEIAHIRDYRNTRRSIDKLARLGIITWEPGRGRGKVSLVGLPTPVGNRVTHDPVSPPERRKAGSEATTKAGSSAARNTGSEATRLSRNEIKKIDREPAGETNTDDHAQDELTTEELQQQRCEIAALMREFHKKNWGSLP